MYRPSLQAGAILVVTLGFVACRSDAPVTSEPLGTPTFALTAGEAAAAIPGQYLVLFKGARDASLSFRTQVGFLGGTVARTFPQVGIAVVSGLDPARARLLARRTDVQVVEPDVILRLEPAVAREIEPVVDDIQTATQPALAAAFALQWNMRAIRAEEAWSAGHLGSADVSIAILDTGIDYLWPDLLGRVDLARSRSFVPEDDAIVAAVFPGRHVVSDLVFHGTHVANTAVSNSNITAGVTTRTTLIGVKVCGLTVGCRGSAVLGGILYAADAGAHIANVSLGGAFSKDSPPFRGLVSIFNRVANYANTRGTLLVVAAGNDTSDMDHDGATFNTYCDAPNVVCVSATGPTAAGSVIGPFTNVDAPTGYTNFGRSAISVAAPGGSDAAVVWAACSRTTLVTVPDLSACRSGFFLLGLGGTSMAAPHASGVAALIAAQVGRNPALIRARLQQSADDLGQPGTDPFYGKGRVNAARAAM